MTAALREFESLQLSNDSFILSKEISDFVLKARATVLGGHLKLKDTVICILEVDGECITDISTKIGKDRISFKYIDRP